MQSTKNLEQIDPEEPVDQVFADLTDLPTAAKVYLKENGQPVPLREEDGKLIPKIKWSKKLTVELDEIDDLFGDDCDGIAKRTGKQGNGFLVIDLDHPVAVKLAPHFLPETPFIFGREGNPSPNYSWRPSDLGERALAAGLTAVFRDGFSERLGVDVRGSSGGTCRLV